MAVDPNWDYVALQCPMNGADGSRLFPSDRFSGLIDAGYGPNVTISIAQNMTGGASCFVPADEGIETLSENLLIPWSTGWKFEWAYRTSSYPSSGKYSQMFYLGVNFFGLVDDAGGLEIYYDTGSEVRLVAPAATVTLDTWNVFELSVVAGSARLFKSGTLVAGPTAITLPGAASNGYVYIGSWTDASYDNKDAYFDRIRLSAVGGHTSGFTEDNQPFPYPVVSGTVLENSVPVSRTVLFQRCSTLELAGGVVSDGITGAYSFIPGDYSEYAVTKYCEVFNPNWDRMLFAARLEGVAGGTSFPALKGGPITATAGVTTEDYPTPVGSSSVQIVSPLFGVNRLEATIPHPGTRYTIRGFFKTSGFYSYPSGVLTVGNANFYIDIDGKANFEIRNYAGYHLHCISPITTVPENSGVIQFSLVRDGKAAYLVLDGVIVAFAFNANSGGDFVYPSVGVVLGNANPGGGVARGFNGRLAAIQILRGADVDEELSLVTTPFLGPPSVGSREQAQIYDRVIPGQGV